MSIIHFKTTQTNKLAAKQGSEALGDKNAS